MEEAQASRNKQLCFLKGDCVRGNRVNCSRQCLAHPWHIALALPRVTRNPRCAWANWQSKGWANARAEANGRRVSSHSQVAGEHKLVLFGRE